MVPYYDVENLSKRLHQLRKARKVSAREMSLAMGQNGNYINSIELGKSLPSIEGLVYICQYLGVTVSEFFDDGNAAPGRLRELCDNMKKLSPKQIDVIFAMVDDMLARK